MLNKILVIEDEEDMLEELRDLLLYERFQVMSARDGEGGWAQMLADPPDLVLCNVRMRGGIDGFELLQRFRANQDFTLIPFVFLTARSTPDDFRRAMNLGADDYLVKPIRSEELLNAIRARLARYRAIRSQHKESFGLHQRVLLHYFPHELYTPLNALLGVARVLRRKSAGIRPERLLQLSEVLLRNGARLYHLLQNQLLYLELESGPLQEPAAPGQPGLSLAIEKLLGTLARERAENYERAQDLQLSIEPASVPMLDRHFQVISRELIDNAFKFSDAGSPVIVSTRRLDGQTLQLRVVNAGSGLSPEQIAQIGAFTQFDRSRHEQQGLGLGLMLTKRLLQLYGYPMEIDSVPGRYTQVEVQLAVVE